MADLSFCNAWLYLYKFFKFEHISEYREFCILEYG